MPVQLSQYIEIWDALREVTLTPTQPDIISWCVTTGGAYNASSAYHVQFFGCHPKFIANKIWTRDVNGTDNFRSESASISVFEDMVCIFRHPADMDTDVDSDQADIQRIW
jgi:hypothetical protein